MTGGGGAVQGLGGRSGTVLAPETYAFKGGGAKIEDAVAQSLTTLLRYGRISELDGRYVARRVA